MEEQKTKEWKLLLGSSVDRDKRRSLRSIRKLAESGIPEKIRPEVYGWLLEPERRLGNYAKLASTKIDSEEITYTISADSVRALPGNAHSGLQSSDTLKRILTAYANHCPECGYTQGMSNLASRILKYSLSEEIAYERFSEFMKIFNFAEVFRPGFPLLFRWIRMFEELVASRLPVVHRKLIHHGVTSAMYVDKWFLTGMTYNFSEPACERIWDIMLVDGNEKILFRVGLTVLALGEVKGVFDKEFEDVVHWLQGGYNKEEELQGKNLDAFIKKATKVTYRRPSIARSIDSQGGVRRIQSALCLAPQA